VELARKVFQAVFALKQSLKEKVIVSSTGSLGTGNSIEFLPELKFNLI